MAAHVMCLTSAGGIPVFTRRKGEGEMMTFSKMASLNGVHMFLKSQNADLLVTYMPDTTVVWKEFEGCITLIVMASGTTKYVLDKFLTLVFNAMVLVAGIDEIKNPRNLERLKKDLRVCNPIIDKLLECLDIGDRIGSKTDLIDMTESIMYTENHLFQVAFRLVSVTLVNHIEVLALCGTMPELPEIERLAIQCWRSSIDILRTSELYYPRNFPVGTSLDSGILGFLLANYKVEKFVLSRNSQHSKNRITGAHRLDTLRTFYYQAVETFMLLDDTQEANKERSTNCSMNPTSRHNSEGLFHGAKETYWCSEYHKCHALKDDSHIFCVLYTSTIPTHTMRLITQKTLKTLLADKLVCW
ncbi:protein fuzzy homolog isoform X2 [Orussus abietinus]|uniref:protein fuzzy homolog isoform X2 n=1 Tax=Orussus abietinus TaxID=222816 RepID=UPI000626DBF4|nr:protein fuzzy homolog isoform X2 [Orussus abietinus]